MPVRGSRRAGIPILQLTGALGLRGRSATLPEVGGIVSETCTCRAGTIGQPLKPDPSHAHPCDCETFVSASRTQDLIQPRRHPRVALQKWIAQSVVIIDVYGAVTIAVLDQEFDRRIIRLGGFDEFLQAIAVIGEPVHS